MNRCSSTSCSHLRLFSSFSVTFRRAFVHWREGSESTPQFRHPHNAAPKE